MKRISDNEIQVMYASLMAEIKARLQRVELEVNLSRIPRSGQEETFKAEFCYLQLRRITELTSVSILLAHNPYDKFRTKALSDIHNAKSLIEQLGKLNADAFPQRTTSDKKMPDGGLVTFDLPAPNFVARDLIGSIYTTACDKMHAGAFRSIMKTRNKTYSWPFIHQSWANLVALLNSHMVILPDKRILHSWLNYQSDELVFCQWLDPVVRQPSLGRHT